VALPAAARRVIDDHVRLLLAWNAAINLTAIRAPAEIAVRHVVDSLAAVPILRERRIATILDLGSGGGYPGIPLAVVLSLERTLLVESVGKKAAFLRTVVEATGIAGRVRVEGARVEALGRDPVHRERWPAVTARAVGALAELVELSFPLLRPGGRLIAWKRKDLDAEIEAARRAVTELGGGQIEVHPVTPAALADHRIVIVTKRGRTSAAYPRDPASRRRRPW
jgi:16S rRNA (guanine527-N7)-methyltransferase